MTKRASRAAGQSGYCGRFAPSPTGDLHFGSLVAAVGSYARARSLGGRWLLRIEDLDPPREVTGAAQRQLDAMRRFGLLADGPVRYQSRSDAAHRRILAGLLESGAAFPCACTRRDLRPDGRYPGTCRKGIPEGRRARSVRLRVTDEDIGFVDGVQGYCRQNPARQTGDFVIRRADGLIAYQLAVVVDDLADGITEVVRGADLFESTARQIHLHRCLGQPPPAYAHLPVIVDANGRKLSKSEGDDPVARLAPGEALRLALRALGHEPPAGCRSLDAQWQWAISHWRMKRVPRGPVAMGVPPEPT
jgi:glutamyl-Q tRNA(Asp) synthetase